MQAKPKHKIFLSHSGEQKEFVELLCERLESRCHTPFFDKRSSSLPKAETFANLIFQVVEQCEMMVVVISDDFFMSKWPMMELQTFVQAVEAMKDKPCNTKEKYILPLFYKLSVEEFRDKERREKWAKTWMVVKEGAKRRQIDAHAWEKAVDVLGTYNGMEYKSSGIKDYLDEIVSHICDKIIADVKWDDSHVQGKSNICKVLCENIQSVGCLEEFGFKILGIFGVGGVGKTTICKAMWNELSIEYEGRVCHIELETQVRTSQATTSIVVESLRKLVMLLTNKNVEFVQKLDEGQCKYILRNSGNSRKTFIAIDNVWDNHASIKHAKTILEIPNFHEESLVIVTARSRDTLEMLGIRGDVCIEMPELGEVDATKLFLYHAAGGKQFGGEDDKCDILRCIKRCYFDKSGGNGYHYHPLALQSLGVQLGCVGKKPSEWVEKLPRVRNFNYLGGENPVFDILRSSFDMLRACEQSLFMDLVVYNPFLFFGYNYDFESCWELMMACLCVVHEVGEDGLKSMFDGLKRKGLLQDVDWTSGRIIVHDLYLQFAELESRGELDDLEDLDHRRCMNISRCNLIELERSPSGKCWQRLSRVYIHDIRDDHQQLDYQIQMDWRFSNVQVLKLNGLDLNSTSLNVEALKCLRSLTILCVRNLEKIKGLGGLRNLTFFKFVNGNYGYDTIIEQLPASLKVVYVVGPHSLNPDILSQCSNLCKLGLHNIQAVELDLSRCLSLQSVVFNDIRELHSLDLSSCSSLESVELQEVESLTSLMLLPNPRVACGLKSFKVYGCGTLVHISGLDELLGLESLVLVDTPFQHLPDVHKWTKLQVLRLEFKAELYLEQERQGEAEGAGCFFPPQLRELEYSCASTKAPNLSGCTHLEVLDLSIEFHDDDGLATNLKCLEDLPALRSLSLSGCRVLSGWPDLSRSRKLEEIILRTCEIELHENDIRMLTLLPLLGPLKIFDRHLKLDLVRWKVLSWSYQTFGWEESDLGTPPIKLIRSNRLL